MLKKISQKKNNFAILNKNLNFVKQTKTSTKMATSIFNTRGQVLFASETAKTFKEALAAAVKAGAKLKHLNAKGQDLSGLNLSGIDFVGADFSNCNLNNCDFSSSLFNGAKLRFSTFIFSKFENAYLAGADLSGTGITYSELNKAQAHYISASHARPSGVEIACRITDGPRRSSI